MEQHGVDEPAAQQPGAPARTGVPQRSRKRWIALPLVAAAGLAIAVSVLPPDSAPSAAPSSTLSAVATPSAAPSAAPAAPAADPGPAASQPIALSFADAGIDMAVLPLTPSDADLAAQSLVPPLTIDAYWLTPYGVPGAGSNNTTYIAGHSWDGQDAPFNRLSNEALVGSEFTLTTQTGDITYVVDSVLTHDKDTLKDSDIWNIVPNRVVLISCYTEDPWGKNVVVTAMPKTA
ncbi:class F sortase [Arthrobacter burdickii]|uniref:Class F sortase n=1 Tax=Arthrobacter burdickii TaxID=3035920 RepID=A0ABT8JW77_9MICC|nr:class F sortase [Arthrobacter burdickii]MDN4609349.1 class F sortase [Arthrobacter burdickii]